jgi:hypothetical protein
MTYIGDANDTATILSDADTFFSGSGWFQDSDAQEVTQINELFNPSAYRPCPESNPPYSPPYNPLGQQTSGLIQVYDLVAPLDPGRAETYLSRLGAIAGALLANRDDVRGFPQDPFRGNVMKAWGAYTLNRDCQWNTDVTTSALFLYAMAAFARRVADNPNRYSQFSDQAITLIDAAFETYEEFHAELHLADNDPFAYYFLPLSYRNLTCNNGASECAGYRDGAGLSIAFNENLSMMKALAELALAANSNLYRASPNATPDRMQMATEEVPLVIAKNVAYRNSNLRAKTLADLTPYYEWDTQTFLPQIEDVPHAQFELGSLAVILENQVRLNELLANAGRAERIPLDPSMFVRFANTFLRKVWRNNILSRLINGSGTPQGGPFAYDVECAGWIPLAQFDPWVWTRSRDTIFNPNSPSLRVDNHGALLRYRKFNSMKFLTDFAGQNWLITPAALAVGEHPPKTIRDQKWLLVLSGIVLANLKGDNSGGWNYQTVSFMPDMAGPDDPTATSGPLNWAINQYSIPRPPGSVGSQYLVRFSLEEWSPFVSLSSIFDQAQSINAGFAVNDWRPNHFDSGTDVFDSGTDVFHQPTVGNIFTGINADLAVSDSDAWLYRVSYNITLLGKIVFIAPTIIERPDVKPSARGAGPAV